MRRARMMASRGHAERHVVGEDSTDFPTAVETDAASLPSRSSSRSHGDFSRPKTLLVGSSVTAAASDVSREHYSPTQVRAADCVPGRGLIDC